MSRHFYKIQLKKIEERLTCCNNNSRGKTTQINVVKSDILGVNRRKLGFEEIAQSHDYQEKVLTRLSSSLRLSLVIGISISLIIT